MSRLKFKAGMILEASKKNPRIKRWQKIDPEGNPLKELRKSPLTKLHSLHLLQEHYNINYVGDKFSNLKSGLQDFNDKVVKNSHLEDVKALYNQTNFRVGNPAKDISILGFPIWIGPHYQPRDHTISVAPTDLDAHSGAMGHKISNVAKGNYGAVIAHEAAHSWDFSRAAANGHHLKSYWLSEVHPQIQEATGGIAPGWMTSDKGVLGRLAYARVVPHEMPAVMTELSISDPARYHAANELFKEQHGIDLDKHMTQFWGTSITPARPTDGSVEKIKRLARKESAEQKKRAPLPTGRQRWAYRATKRMAYSQEVANDGDITQPDHRISWLDFETLAQFWPDVFSDTDN